MDLVAAERERRLRTYARATRELQREIDEDFPTASKAINGEIVAHLKLLRDMPLADRREICMLFLRSSHRGGPELEGEPFTRKESNRVQDWIRGIGIDGPGREIAGAFERSRWSVHGYRSAALAKEARRILSERWNATPDRPSGPEWIYERQLGDWTMRTFVAVQAAVYARISYQHQFIRRDWDPTNRQFLPGWGSPFLDLGFPCEYWTVWKEEHVAPALDAIAELWEHYLPVARELLEGLDIS
jgi:hypothetical protein